MYGLQDDIQELREEIKKLKEERETLRQKLIEDIQNHPIEFMWIGYVKGEKVSQKLNIAPVIHKDMINIINKRFGVEE